MTNPLLMNIIDGTVTSGEVEYTSPRPFDSAAARVKLTYTVAPTQDAEAVGDAVGAMAKRQAQRILGQAVDAAEPRSIAQDVRNTKEYPPDGIRPRGPGAVSVVDIMGKAANPTVTAAQPVVEVEQSEAPAPEPATITDKRLMDEVTARNAALITAAGDDDMKRQSVPVSIHALIGEYTDVPPGPGRLSKIPQEQRAAFLKALAAL